MALLSPGIQLFESSVTPPATTAAAGNGVATLGFSTRGPVGKLVRVSSASEFQKVFGDPIKDDYFAHILVNDVLASNVADVYFMRVADISAAEAKCPVIDFPIKGAKVAIKDNISKLYTGYLMAFLDKDPNTEQPPEPANPYMEISYGNDAVYVALNKSLGNDKFPPAGNELKDHNYVLWNSISNVIAALESNDNLNANFRFTAVGVPDDKNPEVGIIVTANNEAETELDLSGLAVDFGEYDVASGVFTSYSNITGLDINKAPEVLDGTGTGKPTTFGGEELRPITTLDDYEELDDYSHFELTAKYPGSSMNDFKVTKTTSTTINGDKMWTISVYDGVYSDNPIESMTFKADDLELFEKKMGQFSYIDVNDVVKGDDQTSWTWDSDGVWVLGKGQRLSNGEYWYKEDEGESEPKYIVQEGSDGYPTEDVAGKQYSEDQANQIYLEALGDESFLNTDEINFSILAIPGTQNTAVQNAAIGICATRGDAIFLADVPEEKCGSKAEIADVVEWANGNGGFQSSYCAIYYGWFARNNPYNSDNSIICPASCFIAPKMLVTDNTYGEFYAPAGITRGTLVCSDWLYSPDQSDRDKLVGNSNVVNPISYSNTRGVTIMSQKTTDRTTSPLNRVGVRRMTNKIKRVLRSQLVALLFEPNNEVARSRARTIVDNVLSGLRTNNCIETYDISVVSGTGANRNDLNVYLSFAPYGLIEKIYVYLSITDAGVEVTETVA